MSLATTTPAGQSIPKLAEPFESEAGDSTPRATTDADEKKKKKRSLFGFGKQKEEPAKSPSRSVPSQDTVAARRGNNASPVRTETPHFIPTSPGRGYTSTSPRLASPAGSQIFERDVQESTALPTSPAIPSHIQTENYIPPVLDASSEAITDGHLDPDNVEIITHASHQPAAVTVTGAAPLEPSWADELAAFANERTGTDSASNYGSFDTTDVRRLSFISFADVVQAEQHTSGIAGSRDSMHLAGLTSLASLGVASNRSPSPIRSPVSSAGGPGTSPPTSKSGSIKGLEMSPTRKPLGSPAGLHPHHGLGGANSPTVSGEISIETMSQALRRTGSGDFSVVRSMPSSPI